ncbi:MAG: TlpA family protein disulfide reductase [Clostridia bacterium]|nr:TlpA family protein disulfide reductase [Clostridia bacterium]
MKRWFSILLILLLLLGGCSESNTQEGLLSSFSAAELGGDLLDQSVLADKKLTMVNIWATYCGPCIREMPDLAALDREYEKEGFQVIGIVSDVYTLEDTTAENARTILNNCGCDYLNLLPDQSLTPLLGGVSAVPTTVFVDERGNQVGETYIGSRSKEDWAAIIDSLLKEIG